MINVKVFSVSTMLPVEQWKETDSSDHTHTEFIDEQPTFIDELRELFAKGELMWFSVKFGYLNGGDSIEIANPFLPTLAQF